MANLVAIPNALTTFLNAGTFTTPFSAFKKWYPTIEPSDYKDLKVIVALPLTKSLNLENRENNDGRLGVSVLVRQQVDKNDDTKVSELMTLCDEICDYLLGSTITGTKFVCLGVEFNALPHFDDLDQIDLFTGAFTFTYMDLNR